MGLAKMGITLLAGAFLTMLLIYFIKKAAAKYNIPVVNKIAEGV